MKTRYIQSIAATARTTDVTLPWHRGQRAERAMSMQGARARLTVPATRGVVSWAA